jgi:hypothetical protein
MRQIQDRSLFYVILEFFGFLAHENQDKPLVYPMRIWSTTLG